MLGLARDSHSYSNSIFYAPWTTTQAYDPVDEALIEMLYRPQTLRGLGYREAVDILRTMTRRSWTGTASDVVPGWGGVQGVQDPRRPRGDGKGGIGSGG
jgi:hypothetical protein